MTKAQRWVFILFTLPLCSLILALGLFSMKTIPSDLNVRIGNVRHNSSTYKAFSSQEEFKTQAVTESYEY